MTLKAWNACMNGQLLQAAVSYCSKVPVMRANPAQITAYHDLMICIVDRNYPPEINRQIWDWFKLETEEDKSLPPSQAQFVVDGEVQCVIENLAIPVGFKES